MRLSWKHETHIRCFQPIPTSSSIENPETSIPVLFNISWFSLQFFWKEIMIQPKSFHHQSTSIRKYNKGVKSYPQRSGHLGIYNILTLTVNPNISQYETSIRKQAFWYYSVHPLFPQEIMLPFRGNIGN